MTIFLKIYLLSFAFMAALDGLWLGIIAKSFYKKWIGHLMSDSPKWLAAGFFYPLYILGLSIFVIFPAIKNQTPLLTVFLLGALFGLVAYGTYDLTNQATLKDWPVIVTLVDLAWGSLIAGAISVITAAILR